MFGNAIVHRNGEGSARKADFLDPCLPIGSRKRLVHNRKMVTKAGEELTWKDGRKVFCYNREVRSE